MRLATRRQIVKGGAALLGGLGLFGATRLAEAASIPASDYDDALVATIGVSKRDRRTLGDAMNDLLDKGASVNRRGLVIVGPGMYAPPPKLPFVDIVSMSGARKTILQTDQKLSPVSLYTPVSDSLLRDFTLCVNITGPATGGAVIDARGAAVNWAIEDVIIEVVNAGGTGKAHLLSLGGANSGSVKGLTTGDLSRAEEFSMGDKYAGVSTPWAGALEFIDHKIDMPVGMWGLSLFDSGTSGNILWENVRLIQDGSGAPNVALWHSGGGGEIVLRNCVLRGIKSNDVRRGAPHGGGLYVSAGVIRLHAYVENSFVQNVGADRKGTVVLFGSSYGTLSRHGTGVIVDLGTHTHPTHMHVVRKTWTSLTQLYDGQGVRNAGGMVALSGSGDLLLSVLDNQANSAAATARPHDADGAFPSKFRVERCPRYVQEAAFSSFAPNLRAFFGLRANRLANKLPTMNEIHAGIIFTGTAFIASSSDGGGVGQTSLVAGHNIGTALLRRLKFEVVIYGNEKVVFKTQSGGGESDDYSTHMEPPGLPTGDLDYQELLFSTGEGGPSISRVTLGEGFVEENTY